MENNGINTNHEKNPDNSQDEEKKRKKQMARKAIKFLIKKADEKEK